MEAQLRGTALAPPGSRLHRLLGRREALYKQLNKRTLALGGNLQDQARNLAYKRRKSTIKLIERLDNQILTLTTTKYRVNGLSPMDRDHIERAIELLSSSDQEVRFAGVHRYFESEILPHIAQQ